MGKLTDTAWTAAGIVDGAMRAIRRAVASGIRIVRERWGLD